MTDTVRIGMIGTSWWMDLAHLPMFNADSRVEMAAICGRNRERAQEMADKYGVKRVFTDYRKMIDEGELDAIVISSPDDLHLEMTTAAIEAGLHVLCEKPLALNTADARTMYEMAEARGVRHMTFFTWRWMPQIRYMRQLVEEGAVGRLYHCHFRFLMGSALGTDYQWRFDRKRANGVIGDSGSHMFDLARYMVGDISEVSARLATNVQRQGLNGQPLDPASDSAMALVEFEGGASGTVQVSMVARVDDTFLEQQVALYGEAGSLISDLTMDAGPSIRLASGDDPFQTLEIPPQFMQGIDTDQAFFTQFVPMFANQPIGCRLFVDAILKNRPVVPSFYDGWKAQQIIDAALASHETGCWVDITN